MITIQDLFKYETENFSGKLSFYQPGMINTDNVQTVIDYINENPRIHTLQFFTNDLSPELVEKLVQGLKNNTFVKNLWISADLEFGSFMAWMNFLKENKSLSKLTLRRDTHKTIPRIGQPVLQELAKIFEVNDTLSDLDLSEFYLMKEELASLSGILNSVKTLKSLDLSGDDLKDGGLSDIADALKNNTNLESLKLRGQLGPSYPLLIREMLQGNKNLRRLVLHSIIITPEDLASIFQTLEANTTLKTLEMPANNITGVAAKALGSMLGNNNSLEILNLPSRFQTDENIEHVMNGLVKNTGLKTVDLTRVDMGEFGEKFIVRLIKDNKSIVNLYLKANGFTSQGFEAIVDALTNNTTLKAFKLGDEQVIQNADAPVLTKLGEMIEKNNTLTELELSRLFDSKLSISLRDFLKGLRNNSTLKKLSLSWQVMTPEDVTVLAESLLYHESLESLGLDNTHLNDEGARSIARMLESNAILQDLNLRNNHISDQGIEFLFGAFRFNSTLRELKLDRNQFSFERIKNLSYLESNHSLLVLTHSTPLSMIWPPQKSHPYSKALSYLKRNAKIEPKLKPQNENEWLELMKLLQRHGMAEAWVHYRSTQEFFLADPLFLSLSACATDLRIHIHGEFKARMKIQVGSYLSNAPLQDQPRSNDSASSHTFLPSQSRNPEGTETQPLAQSDLTINPGNSPVETLAAVRPV
jgi:Ran GTPase-activating protein (RanGAP) involved in mRNA processing and transport